MALAKFGKKRVCGNCNTKFYDMLKEGTISCPHCKSEVDLEIFSNSQNFASDFSNSKNNLQKQENSIAEVDNLGSEESIKEFDDNEKNDQDIVSLEEIEENN